MLGRDSNNSKSASHITRTQKEIRTLRLSALGSDFYCLVRATGLEPARRGHRFLRPTRLPFRHARMDIKYSIKKPRCQSYYRQKKPSCRFFIYRGILRRCFSEYFPDVKTNTGFFTKKRPKISTKLPKTLDSADLL